MVYGTGKYGLVYLAVKPAAHVNIGIKYSAVYKDSLQHQLGVQLDTRW
jgi:hypothetical protein